MSVFRWVSGLVGVRGTSGDELEVTASNAAKVDGSAVTQPVSAASLPLPTGAATEATLSSLETKDFATQTTLATRASEATLASIKNTDGIKKITDQLPTGTNTIGKTDQGLPGGATTGWYMRIVNTAGSIVGVLGDLLKVGIFNGSNQWTIDSSGAGKTYVALPIPNPSLVPVSETYREGASGAAEVHTFVIPNGKTLNLLSFQAGAEVGVDGARIALYYAPAGSLNGTETIVANAYCNGSNFVTALSESYTGDGTAAMILELDNLGGGTLEVYGRWTGERTP